MKSSSVKTRNKHRLFISILFLLNMIACSVLSGENPSVDSPPTKPSQSPPVTDDQNWVIFTEEQAEEMELASWLVDSDGFWTPSVDDILNLEEKIVEYLSQNSSYFYRQPPVWERLHEYQRQYIGLERGGRKIIYGNYFCNSGGVDWQQKLVIVIDGGECFFQIEYDVESELFIKLLVNGEA
jgi:hypothetical protein